MAPNESADLKSMIETGFRGIHESLGEQSTAHGEMRTEVGHLKESVSHLTKLFEHHADGPVLHRLKTVEGRHSNLRTEFDEHVRTEVAAEIQEAKDILASKDAEAKEHRRRGWAIVAAIVTGAVAAVGYLANWLLDKFPHMGAAK